MKRVFEVDWSRPDWNRAAFIPVAVTSNTTFYGLGLTSGTASLSDFGGKWEPQDYDLLDTALRELSEESLDMINPPSSSVLPNLPVLEGKDTALIFLPYKGDPWKLSSNFRREIRGKKAEQTDIIWLTQQQILAAVDNSEHVNWGMRPYNMAQAIRYLILENRDIFPDTPPWSSSISVHDMDRRRKEIAEKNNERISLVLEPGETPKFLPNTSIIALAKKGSNVAVATDKNLDFVGSLEDPAFLSWLKELFNTYTVSKFTASPSLVTELTEGKGCIKCDTPRDLAKNQMIPQDAKEEINSILNEVSAVSSEEDMDPVTEARVVLSAQRSIRELLEKRGIGVKRWWSPKRNCFLKRLNETTRILTLEGPKKFLPLSRDLCRITEHYCDRIKDPFNCVESLTDMIQCGLLVEDPITTMVSVPGVQYDPDSSWKEWKTTSRRWR